jgi:hypothetical protein
MAARIIQEDEWQDTGDVWEDIPEEEPVIEPVVNESPMMPNLWETANKPLIDLAPIANKLANWVDKPTLDSGITGDGSWTDLARKVRAGAQGFKAGAIQGLGDVISSFTSPLELGLAAATGGSSLAAKRGLGTLSKGLAAAGTGLSAAEGLHGGGEVIGGLSEGNLPRVGLGVAELAGSIAGGKENIGNLFKSEIPIPKVTPKPTLETTTTEPIIKSIPTPNTDWIDIDSTVDTMVDEALATQPKSEPVVAAPAEKPKPKIKVKLNPMTNSLEPDLTDELTAKLFNSAKTGEPVPDGQRLNPDEEIDFNDLIQGTMFDLESDYKPMTKFAAEGVDTTATRQLVDARQGEMKDVRLPESTVKATGEAGNLTNANQTELPGNIRKPKPDKFAPGGSPSKAQENSRLQEWMGLPRALQSAFDLSFPLRQGLGLIHTKGWWKAWPDMIKSFGSDEAYKGVMDSIANRPNFRGRIIKTKTGKEVVEQSLAQKAGLAITDLVSNREEELGSKIAGQIPGIGRGIKGSNRAYNAFANKLRADAFDALIAANPAAKTDLVLAKELANFVNNASGRGSLKFGQKMDLEGAASALNNMLFSPRLMASRVQMLNPKNYVFTRPEVRKEYLKSMMGMAVTWTTMAGLAKQAGAEVSLDPESTDFGKIKIGNTRLDPAGGFQQYIVLASRLAKGGLDKARQAADRRYSGKAFGPTPENDVLNFLENKMAPNVRFATGPWRANKAQPFEMGDQAIRTFTPIILQDLSEIMQEDPELAWTLLPGLVGVGSNTYQPGKKSPTLLPPSLWNRKKDITFQ